MGLPLPRHPVRPICEDRDGGRWVFGHACIDGLPDHGGGQLCIAAVRLESGGAVDAGDTALGEKTTGQPGRAIDQVIHGAELRKHLGLFLDLPLFGYK